jgi:hypothetical protein
VDKQCPQNQSSIRDWIEKNNSSKSSKYGCWAMRRNRKQGWGFGSRVRMNREGGWEMW